MQASGAPPSQSPPLFIYTVKHLTTGWREITHQRRPASRRLINKADGLSQYPDGSKRDAAAAAAARYCATSTHSLLLLLSVFPVYYRALVNFTDSLVYTPDLEDIFSPAFIELSEAVVDTVRSARPSLLPYKDGAKVHVFNR